MKAISTINFLNIDTMISSNHPFHTGLCIERPLWSVYQKCRKL